MAGHSHWAGIKHKKGIADKKRGKLFSKLTKNIMIAVRDGGPDLTTNLRLRYAVDKAKEANMPKVNIERAIKKMSEGNDGNNFEEIVYGGYGPGGVAILAEIITDNRNRTASEVRKIFDNGGGKMGESASVAYLFDRKGLITVAKDKTTEDALMDIIMEAGAEDMAVKDDYFEVIAAPADFQGVRNAITDAEIEMSSMDLIQMPQQLTGVDDNTGKQIFQLLENLEDHDDVQSVYTNCDLSQVEIE